MQTNNTPPTQPAAQQPTDEGLDDAVCSPLVWTRAEPSGSGYYWYRHHVLAKPVIYDVAANERFGFVKILDGSAVEITNFKGWWAGPIPRPLPLNLPENKIYPHKSVDEKEKTTP
jgi:hypothetical protein